jgi:hypothetical protein
MECGAHFSWNLCTTSQDLSQRRTLLKTSAGWCKEVGLYEFTTEDVKELLVGHGQ